MFGRLEAWFVRRPAGTFCGRGRVAALPLHAPFSVLRSPGRLGAPHAPLPKTYHSAPQITKPPHLPTHHTPSSSPVNWEKFGFVGGTSPHSIYDERQGSKRRAASAVSGEAAVQSANQPDAPLEHPCLCNPYFSRTVKSRSNCNKRRVNTRGCAIRCPENAP